MCHDAQTVMRIASAIGAGYASFEYWLGKTKKVQANSLFELILIGVTAMGAWLLTRKREK